MFSREQWVCSRLVQSTIRRSFPTNTDGSSAANWLGHQSRLVKLFCSMRLLDVVQVHRWWSRFWKWLRFWLQMWGSRLVFIMLSLFFLLIEMTIPARTSLFLILLFFRLQYWFLFLIGFSVQFIPLILLIDGEENRSIQFNFYHKVNDSLEILKQIGLLFFIFRTLFHHSYKYLI